MRSSDHTDQQLFEYIHVIGTTQSVVGTEQHYRCRLYLPGVEQRRTELGIGRKQIAYYRFYLAAEGQKLSDGLFGLVHLGR